ncbi:DUF6294 family protein [Fodinicola acaciae]|uniref:DUF6294 family protein n=1 Tax=Fodinicola acaciae TaxID=2681555 RepID=UPI001FE25FEF|nr:DUF6294 family protein [Fodinicola acaciae]
MLAGSLTLASPASAAHADRSISAKVMRANAKSLAVNEWTWTLPELHSGDCTMFGGATWTFRENGTADFRGTVTSSDDHDAWIQWIDVFDKNGAFMGNIVNTYPDTPDPTRFAKNLPDSSLQYAWYGYGHFNADWYWNIGHVQLHYHC